MKLIHLSDLHLGKRVHEYSMLEDQKYILTRIINVIDEENPDAVIIAGDIYDKAMPPAEAVQLFDDFLVRLSERNLKVLVISGNHDSAERIAFGRKLMDKSGVYMSQVFDGNIEPLVLNDEFGPVNFYMLPFIKPVHVKHIYENNEIETYTDAVKAAVTHMNVDTAQRNVIITHQFVTGAERSESEEISVGGSDNVDASAFDGFDYVALGHIHGPQNIGSPYIRYCGTPLKYSFSEANHHKSVTIVELREKGDVSVRTAEFVPMHDMRELRGTYNDLMNKENYEGTAVDDYIHITLTDEEDEPDALRKLGNVYPHILKFDYDNTRTRNQGYIEATQEAEKKTPLEHFEEFYEKQNGKAMNDSQSKYIADMIASIWEGDR